MRLGILGGTLKHTRSPEIHQKIFARTGKTGSFDIFEKKPEEVQDFVYWAKEVGLLGFNVTIPYKTVIMDYLDEVSREAQKIGAVNTVHIQAGKLTGYNTDYFGFGYTLKKAGIEVVDKRACVLGAGGAAKAAAVYLKDEGANVTVISRDAERAKLLFPGFAVAGYDTVCGDVLVNTTPVGMFPKCGASPVSRETVSHFGAVADIVYNPRETVLLQYARACGLPAADGLFMVVAQAVKGEEIWQGTRIADSVIDEITEEMA